MAQIMANENRASDLHARVISDLAELNEFVSAWDALAVASRRPRSVPAWVMSWYRKALPSAAEVRAVIVTDGDTLVGICPLFVMRNKLGLYRYALAAPILNGVEPLTSVRREREVGHMIGSSIAAARPIPDVVDLFSADGVAPRAIWQGWPGPRPELFEDDQPLPSLYVVHTGRSFEDWLSGRSRNFRQAFRSDYRKIQAQGFTFRVLIENEDILVRLPHLQRLYELRREARGGAGSSFDASLMDVVVDALQTVQPGRARLCTLEREEEVISATLWLSAGGHTSMWKCGFDEQWAHLSPTHQNITLCIGDSIERGDVLLDLGGGILPYKSRFTDDVTMRQRHVISRRGLRPFHTPAQLLSFRAQQAILGTLTNVRGRFAR